MSTKMRNLAAALVASAAAFCSEAVIADDASQQSGASSRPWFVDQRRLPDSGVSSGVPAAGQPASATDAEHKADEKKRVPDDAAAKLSAEDERFKAQEIETRQEAEEAKRVAEEAEAKRKADEVAAAKKAETKRKVEEQKSIEVEAAAKAKAVLAALKANGLAAPTKIVIKGYSELAPVACNDTAENMQLNRRVEVWAY
jgi:flagellar biosynthesis GTPase FlhF